MNRKRYLVALAGNPNTGKSTIFNALTGARQHVGNWPGKTIEKREGICEYKGVEFKVVDLPGTYSLTAYSDEELIARNFIIKEKPTVVVNIVDASNLNRNLYLTLRLLELTDRLIVVLNMMDLAEEKGMRINVKRLSEILGVPVIPMIASEGIGLRELLDTIVDLIEGRRRTKPMKLYFGRHLEGQIRDIERELEGVDLEDYPRRWIAIKLLEGDSEVEEMLKKVNRSSRSLRLVQRIRNSEIHHNPELEIIEKIYEYIDRIVEEVVEVRPIRKESISDRIDRIVLHKVLGVLILLGIYGMVFLATFSISGPIVEFIDRIVEHLSYTAIDLLTKIGLEIWLARLVGEGAIMGVGRVLTIIPPIAIFFLLYALLEDWGYMTRAAFVMDRLTHSIGLHGRAFLCLLCGFGCSVPAVLATRTIAESKDKLATMLTVPLIPCSARLAVMIFIVSIFFKGIIATIVMLSLVAISIVLVVISSSLLKKYVIPGEHAPFIMEMPPYHRPVLRNVLLFTWIRVKSFLKRASTLIVAVSVLVWILSNYPPEATLDETWIGIMGRAIEPFGAVMGFDWKMTTSLLLAILAKELSIPTLALLYGGGIVRLEEILLHEWTPLTAYTYCLVHMIYMPCISTIITLRLESGSWKWTLLGTLFSILLAVAVGVVTYNIGKYFI